MKDCVVCVCVRVGGGVKWVYRRLRRRPGGRPRRRGRREWRPMWTRAAPAGCGSAGLAGNCAGGRSVHGCLARTQTHHKVTHHEQGGRGCEKGVLNPWPWRLFLMGPINHPTIESNRVSSVRHLSSVAAKVPTSTGGFPNLFCLARHKLSICKVKY